MQLFLDAIKDLNTRYRKINLEGGGHFNVFQILRLESSEVKVHSRFVAELLKPNGSHGQGHLFLELFVKQMQFKNNGFIAEGATVEIERHTGRISEDRKSGGRIDIIITDRKRRKMIIENKIYAKDAENQLLRYHVHCPDADLFYLTLDGHLPGKSACGHLQPGKDFKCISYRSHITAWLSACSAAVDHIPLLRESIKQYNGLLRHLNKQSTNPAMTTELTRLMEENLEAVFTIKANINALKSSLS